MIREEEIGMWISEAWLVLIAAAIFGAGLVWGLKAGCLYAERMTRRVGINPKWVASLDARQQARKMIADSDDATSKELRAGVEAFEKDGGWTDLMLDGEAAQDVLRALDEYIDWKLFAPTEGTDETKRIGFRPRKAKAEESGSRQMSASEEPKRPELFRILLVAHYASVVHAGMRQQSQRLTDSLLTHDRPKLEDGYLFAIALADLAKAARVAQELTPSPALETALAEFDRAFAGARDFRNFLEHWDDYAQGKGHRQALGLENEDTWFWLKPEDPLVLRIGGDEERA